VGNKPLEDGVEGFILALISRTSELIRAIMQSIPCYLCGDTGTPLYQGMKDRHFAAPGDWGFRKCTHPECGLVWLDPMPAEQDIGEFYKDFYTHDSARSQTGRLSLAAQAGRFAVKQINSVVKLFTGGRRSAREINLMFLGDKAPGRLLEIGCGSGERLARLKKLGWQAEGQDIDPKAVGHARERFGLEVHCGDVCALSLPGDAFDAVIMNHVIEHLPDPVKVLAECHRLLKRGGALVLTTPNPASYGHNYFESAWLGLDPPRHLYLFSRSALAHVARKGGFQEFSIETTPARAQSFATGSYEIQRTGRHVLNLKPHPRSDWASLVFQIRAMREHSRNADSGEECVLKAVKTA
jgi:SAM-dependent methyltransferase